MNDTELDEMLNQWKAPELSAELRARVGAMQPRKRRFSWPAWENSKGLIFGVTAGAAMFLFAVAIAAPQTFTSGSIPFTVESEYVSHKADGSTVVRESRTETLRDGAAFTLSSTLPGDELMTLHNRFFFAMQNLFYPLTRTIHGPRKESVTKEVIANDCVRPGPNAPKVLRHEKVLGYDAAVILQSDSDGGISLEWRAPALSCFVLHATWQSRQPDNSYRMTWEKRATKITINHPQ